MKLIFHTDAGHTFTVSNMTPECAASVLDAYVAFINDEEAEYIALENEDILYEEHFAVDYSKIVAVESKRELSEHATDQDVCTCRA